MSDIAIRVENLSKVYKLYDKPIDRLKESLHPFKKKYHKDFYALNSISFDVKRGTTVGIIGRNGAGKSTLLKIITGVLSPTSGHVKVNGKIASLLELGAGFNPEYTGVENIYLQGTLIGYSQEEMDSKVDSILAFAEIGDFVYQPVKSYSSGMFARLAFAIAINVEPDILIVDEALSVGDASFQNRCIRKMEEIGEKGVTILFVSHDTQTVNKFCNQVIWIDGGSIKEKGDPNLILENYMSFMSYGVESQRVISNKPSDLEKSKEGNNFKSNDLKLIDVSSLECFGEMNAKINSIGFFDESDKPITTLKQGTWVKFICEFYTSIDLFDVSVGMLLKDSLNNNIFTFNSYMYKSVLKEVKKDQNVRTSVLFKVPKIYPKEYVVTVALSEGVQISHVQQHWIYSAATINVITNDFVDNCIVSLYPEEVKYQYEQI